MEALFPALASAGRKRSRSDSNIDEPVNERSEKRARPFSGDSSDAWTPRDSVINTPTAVSNFFQQQQYDSDDRFSGISAIPDSPPGVHMTDGDEDPPGEATFSQAFGDSAASGSDQFSSSSWRARMHANRVPTPIFPPPSRPDAGVRAMRLLTDSSIRQHVRQRHPQQNLSGSDQLLEVPSPIDEDEVPTPPSAAETAGSQLSMLSGNDMEIDPAEELPTISIDRAAAESAHLHYRSSGSGAGAQIDADSEFDRQRAISSECAMADDNDPDHFPVILVPKQRQRSGALSACNSPAAIRSALFCPPPYPRASSSSPGPVAGLGAGRA